MQKDKILKVRIDDYTDSKLEGLEKKYNLTRSEIVRRSIGAYKEDLVESLFGTDIMDVVLPFNGAFTVLHFGIAGDNYLSGDGFWIDLIANFKMALNKGFKFGASSVEIEGNYIKIYGGFLQNIQEVLAIIYNTRVEVGIED